VRVPKIRIYCRLIARLLPAKVEMMVGEALSPPVYDCRPQSRFLLWKEPEMALNIAAYGQGSTMYPLDANRAEAIRKAGWTTIILGFLHIDAAGNVFFSENKILSCGCYIGDSNWPGQLGELFGEGSTLTNNLLAGVGGAKVNDFQNIRNIYQSNNNSFERTPLKANFQTLYDLFNSIGTIEMDVEETYDKESFVAFCRMLHRIGFDITFCPYRKMDFWLDSLKELQRSRLGPVKWWDLQCYDGGGNNNPQVWADAITAAIPGFDTNGFILASDWVLASDGTGDCPDGVISKLSHFKNEPAVGGAFLWTIGNILWQGTQNPNPCGTKASMADYVAAVKKALG
jgi:hypothetical protein